MLLMDSSRNVPAPAPRFAALVALVVVLAAACTTDGGGAAAPVPSRATPSSSAPAEGEQEPGAAPGDPAPGEAGPGEVVTVTDERGKATARGEAPRYAQIHEVEVRGDAARLVFHVTLGGRIPPKIGASETARLTVGLLTDDGTRYSLYAQGSQDGWAAYAVGGEAGPYPGDLEVRGRTITFRMPRDYFGAIPAFRWLTNVAYNKGDAYGFDVLPEEGYARFP
jgi:hypothetical protein